MGWDFGAHDRTGLAPAPLTCQKGQWLAEYFNNIGLSGSPAFRRCEAAIDYDWGANGPGNGVASDNFSARWTGVFPIEQGGIEFTVKADDGVRLWLNGELIIDAWVDQGPTTYKAVRKLLAGDHTLKLEFYEHGGGALVQLNWALSNVPIPVPPDPVPPDPTPPEPTPVPPSPATLELSVNGAVQTSGPIGEPLTYKINTKNKTATITVRAK